MQSPGNMLAFGVAALAAIVATTAAPYHDQDKTRSKSNPSTATFTDDKMGPAAFMWPPDREWLGKMDNVEPCGSSEKLGERANFPLSE